MKRKLYLITKTFPHEGGETGFLSPEFPYLCESFDVTVVTTEFAGSLSQTADEATAQSQQLAANTAASDEATAWDEAPTTIDLAPKARLSDKITGLLRFLCHKDAWCEFADIMRSGHDRISQIFRALMFGTAAENFYRQLKKQTKLRIETDAIYYFYWADYKCFGLTMHRRKYPHIHVVARTHGYDLYDEREIYGRQFFKPQMDRGLDRLIFISEYGKEYYLKRYQKPDSGKYPLHRLGVRKYGSQPKGAADRKEFVLVSCSNVVDIKRIELIIEGLSLVEDTVRWIHIGDGPLMELLQSKSQELLGQKKNITYEWKGAISHGEVMEFYRKQPVHCFITTTSTEGSPVSVQEALSYGIPVIGTTVSEIPYMVEGNGILLGENPEPQEVADAISQLCRMDEELYREWREKAYRKYAASFDADVLRPAVVEELLSL